MLHESIAPMIEQDVIFPQTQNEFRLQTRQDVVTFENCLRKYGKDKLGMTLNHICLVDAYDRVQSRNDCRKIFNAVLDVQISFTLLARDRWETLATRNTLFPTLLRISKSGVVEYKDDQTSIFDSEEAFVGKMEIQRTSTTFVLKYRALFDKIMGLIILIFAPVEYETFCNARRKKKTFRRIVNSIPEVPEELSQQIERVLTRFDDTFRTSEAHGTGSLRKWMFLNESHFANPQGELMDYWNFLNALMVNIGKLFSKKEG